MDLKGFSKPNSILRPAPFWAINTRITPEETSRQIADMISVGLSGGFFHSRHGLITDYLGDEWFANMESALKTAKENDGYLWLYDEDLWPSGNAGGQVAGMKDEYRAATLNAYLVAAGEPAPELNADQMIHHCYAIKSREGLRLTDYEIIPTDKIDEAAGYERLFMVRSYTPKIGWWGGESYANLLNPEAMKKFVELTHEVYYKRLGKEFGKRIPGIFTDEPQVSHGFNCIAWWEGIPDVYNKWQGRDFWSDLPFMFFEGAESKKIRLIIHRTILKQFTEAYSKPIFEWCEKHGIEHTGHYNAEDDFRYQIMFHSGGVMAHYRYQHAPGIDHLCRQNDPLLFTCKQVSSAARQLGRKRVLDEIFGVSRHTNTFEDFKWLGDYDLVLGTNFFVPHLTWYSAKGRRKRDYPPVWNYQQTYWKELNPLNDYFTRVSHALTSGKADVNVLLLHSIETATSMRRLGVAIAGKVDNRARKTPVDAPTEDFHAAGYYDRLMRRTLEATLNAGYDCDLGDEGYIEDMGSVEGDKFRIGEMSYKVVIIPPSVTWRPKTFDLLWQFVNNGGRVLMLSRFPKELDCEDACKKWEEFAMHPNVRSLPCSAEAVQTALDEIAPQSFCLKGIDGKVYPHTYVQHRIDSDQDIFFIINSDRVANHSYVLSLKGAAGKTIVKWNPVEGTCREVNAIEENGDLRFEFSLPQVGSILLTVGNKVEGCVPSDTIKPLAVSAADVVARKGSIQKLPEEMDFERTDLNVLVMDRMSVSYDGGKTFEPENLDWRVRRSIADRFDTKASLQWQPWVSIRKGLFNGKGGNIVLRYKFLSDLEKPKAWIVIEDIWKGELFVNGTEVDTANPGWHWDHDFGKIEISDLVKKGENIVDFKVSYDFLTEVEPAYIVGDFGVALADAFRGKIVTEPKKLKAGSWADQGYPFYSGRIVYKNSFTGIEGKQTILRLIRPSGTLYKIRVNGQDAGRILWRPFNLDLTPFVKNGENSLEIEVVSSLQNSWGPLHEVEGDNYLWAGPNAFENDPELRDQINTFNYGLLGGAEIVTD